MTRARQWIGLALLAASVAQAQTSRYFRLETEDASEAVALDSAGHLAWSNAHPAGRFQIQWKAHMQQADWLDYLSGSATATFHRVRLFDPAPPPGMALVPAGDFLMGDSWGGDFTATPVHAVWVSAFYVDQRTVTKALWDDVRSWGLTNGFVDLPPGAGGGIRSAQIVTNGQSVITNWTYSEVGPEHPVVLVNWYDMVKWCNARSLKEGLEPVYYLDGTFAQLYRTGQVDLANGHVHWQGSGYRLPTEAEWEKAARGGLVQHHYPWPSFGLPLSDHVDRTQLNYLGSGDPYEQGSAPPGYYDGRQTIVDDLGHPLPIQDMANAYGLYDMAGNVWEFCWDAYSFTTYQWRVDSGDLTDPRGPTFVAENLRRVDRGGSWLTSSNSLADARVAVRYWEWPATAYFAHNRGFRTVRRAPE
jgi:formylglycine-generating enzyme